METDVGNKCHRAVLCVQPLSNQHLHAFFQTPLDKREADENQSLPLSLSLILFSLSNLIPPNPF
jgi:hypothetical protein